MNEKTDITSDENAIQPERIPKPSSMKTDTFCAREFKCIMYDGDNPEFVSHVMIKFKPSDPGSFTAEDRKIFGLELSTFGNISDHLGNTFTNGNIITMVANGTIRTLEQRAKDAISHAHNIAMRQKQKTREAEKKKSKDKKNARFGRYKRRNGSRRR